MNQHIRKPYQIVSSKSKRFQELALVVDLNDGIVRMKQELLVYMRLDTGVVGTTPRHHYNEHILPLKKVGVKHLQCSFL